MVGYLTDPKKCKHLDANPMYFNCTPLTVLLTKDEADERRGADFSELVKLAKSLKRDGRHIVDAYQTMSALVQKRDAWMLPHVMAVYKHATSHATPAYVPSELDSGSLEHAFVFQRAACRWLERGPVREADGLWIKAAQGSGKTLLQKILQLRYPGQVYTPARRGSTGCFDATSLLKYANEPIVFMNSLKPQRKRGEDVWPDSLLELLELLTDGIETRIAWGAQVHSFTVLAKIICVSTFNRPQTRDIGRRFAVLTYNPETDACDFVEHDGRPGTPSSVRVNLASGLAPASDFPVPLHMAVIDGDMSAKSAEIPGVLRGTAASTSAVDPSTGSGPKPAIKLADLIARYPALSFGGWQRTPALPREGVSASWTACMDEFERACGFVYWVEQEVLFLCNKMGVRLVSLDQALALLSEHDPIIEDAMQTPIDSHHWEACMRAAFPLMDFEQKRPPTPRGVCDFVGASMAPCSPASDCFAPAEYEVQSD